MNLRVYPQKQKAPVDLVGLGKLNVVCGPNSSGKSTILLALAQPNVKRGLRLGKLKLDERAFHSLFSKRGEAVGPVEQARRSSWAVLRERITRDQVLFGDEFESLVDHMCETWKQWDSQVTFDYNKFSSSIGEQAGAAPSAALIPAKRQLETPVHVTASYGHLTDGKDVVHKLFKATSDLTNRDQLAKVRKLEHAFERVTGGASFRTSLNEQQVQLLFSFSQDDLVPSERCGMGLQELLILLYYAMFDPAELLLVEEPENHLHPAWQRELLRCLKEETDKMYVFATHSSTILDCSIVDRVFVSRFEEGTIHIDDKTSRVQALREMGYAKSDFVTANVLAVVEGPHDQEAIETFLRLHIRTPGKKVAFYLLGGENMTHCSLETMKEAFEHVLAFVDSEIEKGSRKIRRDFRKMCGAINIPCQISELPTMEHYYSIDAYRQVFPNLVIPDAFDPGTQIEKQIGASPKGNTAKLAAATPWSHVERTDLGEFIKELARLM